MKASIVDLRYKMNEILKALERNEIITILYHGKIKGTIFPNKNIQKLKIKDHPFFGMYAKETESVEDKMRKIRGNRFHAL